MTILPKVRTWWQQLEDSLLFRPLVAVVLAVVVSTILVSLPGLQPVPERVLFIGDMQAARSLMQVLAGSTITVTGLVFTLLVVALQVASDQYSPRLIGSFTSDRGNQLVISTFLATFAYSMSVLRSLPATDAAEVPRVAITVGMLLATGALISLVYFLNHLTRSIRVEDILSDAHERTMNTIEHVLPDPVRVNEPDWGLLDVPDGAKVLTVPRSGYIQAISSTRLLEVCTDLDVQVRISSRVGDFVVEGTRAGWVWRRSSPIDASDQTRVNETLHRAFHIGTTRSHRQDVAFGLRQIVDVIARALSPGVNDPTTAVDAVGFLSGPMTEIARRRIVPRLRTDDDGVQRVSVPARTFGDYLELACGQPRRYGGGEPAVVAALLRMLTALLDAIEVEPRRRLVIEQAHVLLASADQQMSSSHDREQVRLLALELMADLLDQPTDHGADLT